MCWDFLAILIPLAHLAPQTSAEFAFATWSNHSGYPNGFSWLVGVTTSAVLFIGFDGTCQMCRSKPDSVQQDNC
ncbi:hypothetical protein K458DRAFT_423785 [Lentithecium fluviatile CBS 122367]|uniref:Uncharacterized protein n=1 Tax=Lentithecium fluviatile CBS 122367 TaxID=1168545 RepID=A0A6G1IHW0_9PLEO|nr:hypothetical protein K458DRAFT_423785 [Lentithecium fluviatile CBS 122367]